MGWKALKDKFAIGHLVCVTERGICIGSSYVHDLATINPETGVVEENSTFSGFLDNNYPALRSASAQEILQLVNAPDSFKANIPVYTYEDSQILEKYCEMPGWPNVTHDGCLMYENTFFANKEEAIAKAQASAVSRLKFARQQVNELQTELAKRQAYLSESEIICKDLNAVEPANPSGPAT